MNANDIIPGYTIFDRIEIHDIPRRGNIRTAGGNTLGKKWKTQNPYYPEGVK
jgi:hypothetical protein